MRLLAGSILIVLLASAAHSQSDLWYRELPRYGQIYDPPSAAAVLLGDVDRDGDLDLLCANGADTKPCRKRLYLNDGAGHFTDVTTTHLPAEAENHAYFCAFFVDVDREGAHERADAAAGDEPGKHDHQHGAASPQHTRCVAAGGGVGWRKRHQR